MQGRGAVVREEAQCPVCNEWFELKCEDFIAPFVERDDLGNEIVSPVHVWGWWWKDTHNGGGCPGCGAVVLVESECNIRRVV